MFIPGDSFLCAALDRMPDLMTEGLAKRVVIVTPTTLARAFERGINPSESLAANDGHGFFEALGDGVVTGPTLTNVNDFRAILIE